MQPGLPNLSDTYRRLSADEIASIHGQNDSLTNEAHVAFTAEIQRRGMTAGQLANLHATAIHREAGFNRRERIRRKGTASYLLFRNDLKGTIAAILVFLIFVLIAALVSHHH